MKWVPFTVHIKITPQNPEKRFEYWRDMQKIATMAYEGLLSVASINIANPGGGQHTSNGGTQSGGMGGMTPGMAVKPQFGETPSLMSITGFYDTSNANIQPQPEQQLISGGEVYTASRNNSWTNNPTAIINSQAASLKIAIENAINARLPGSIEFEVYRLEYSGVIFGNRGYHFP
jgi:hypothetical protein